MQKTDFIARIAEQTGTTKKTSRQIVEAALDLISQSLASGEKVVLTGFGTFELRERRERRGVNPQTREPMIIPATKTPSFAASNNLREMVREQLAREHGR